MPLHHMDIGAADSVILYFHKYFDIGNFRPVFFYYFNLSKICQYCCFHLIYYIPRYAFFRSLSLSRSEPLPLRTISPNSMT